MNTKKKNSEKEIENIISSCRDLFKDIDLLLESFLKETYKLFDYERIAIFIRKRKGKEFYLRKMIYQGDILEGEEIIGVHSYKNLESLLNMKLRYFVTNDPILGMYLPIVSDKRIIGLMRIEDTRQDKINPDHVNQLERVLIDLGSEIQKHFMYRNSQDQQMMLDTHYKISEILVSSMEAKEIILSIINVMQQNFLFDNLKLYLYDKNTNLLTGFAQSDFNGNITKLDESFHMLSDSKHRLIKLLKMKEANIHVWEKLIVDIPLRARENVVGVMSAHNLISQQNISKTVISFLKSISNQIGISIRNALRFEEVTHLSNTDSLTGLLRSGYFRNKMEEEIQRAKRYGQQFALLVIDVDDFKMVNDKYGHQKGDEILIELAEILNQTIRKVDFAGRSGGDEFVVYLSNIDVEYIKEIVNRLFEKLSKVDKLDVSIGVAVYPNDGRDYCSLFNKADEAMYKAKKKGKHRYIFTSER